VDDKSRTAKEDINIDAAVDEIKLLEGRTLGKTIEEVTKSWFSPEEKISKLLIAILYEDEVESSHAPPPAGALRELEKIKKVLELRSEKSQSGVFEEIE
jgi:hypothetical protein